MPERRERVCGTLLAGGQSRRMGGGDKALRRLHGRPLLRHIIDRAAPQVDGLVINANGDPLRLAEFDLPVVGDVVEGYAGPLAGVLTGMTWAFETAPDCRWIATFACDAPFFPRDMVARLLSAVEREGADMACAASEGRSHPVFGLWPVRLRDDLHTAMVREEIRKVDAWTSRYRLATVSFEPIDTPAGPLDPFFNTNRPEDLTEAERLLGGGRG